MKIKTTKNGKYQYIGNKTDHDNVKWKCRACNQFKLEKELVLGTGDVICKKCLMNGKYLEVTE